MNKNFVNSLFKVAKKYNLNVKHIDDEDDELNVGFAKKGVAEAKELITDLNEEAEK